MTILVDSVRISRVALARILAAALALVAIAENVKWTISVSTGAARPVADHPRWSFEELGIPDILARIKKDFASHGEANRQPLVFIPHEGRPYNASAFRAYELLRAPIPPNGSYPEPSFFAVRSNFRMGSWGEPGGIPRMFFEADYFVFYPEVFVREFSHNDADLYDVVIHRELSKSGSPFRAGLEVIEEWPAFGARAHGVLLKRSRPVTTKERREIIRIFVEADPGNPFNESWIQSGSS